MKLALAIKDVNAQGVKIDSVQFEFEISADEIKANGDIWNGLMPQLVELIKCQQLSMQCD